MTYATDVEAPVHPESAAAQLIRSGAILALADSTNPILVGYLIWLGRNRLFCFTANGNNPIKDGHLLAFDSTAVEAPSEITFWLKNRLVARLTTIDHSGVPDADTFRAAWQVWQERRPASEGLIGASLTHHLTEASIRSGLKKVRRW